MLGDKETTIIAGIESALADGKAPSPEQRGVLRAFHVRAAPDERKRIDALLEAAAESELPAPPNQEAFKRGQERARRIKGGWRI